MAVQHGMFLYLEKLGYRFYFPNPDWYIVPKQLDLYNPFSYTGRPSFDQRRIWYGYGTVGSKTADSNYRFWFKANRLGGSMNAVIGHSYDDIVSRNKETFKEHPEWLYPQPAKGTLPDNPKFDLANPALVQFIIDDVLKRLEQAKLKGAPLSMVTLAPSDGIGTCNTPACRELGSVTDRVYSLINRVAKEVRQKYPFTWVSGMSYSEYAAPPTKKLEYNTFVSIATAFNNSKYSTDQLISEWSKKAGKVGIYDYLGLYVWDFDLPGQGAATHVDKVAASIRKYYRLGARGYDAESTPGSISKGLGHYIISHLLWDVNVDITATKKEFFRKCFGSSASLIEGLWNEWENYPYSAIRESDLASWIDIITGADSKENDEQIKKRLTHIKVYLHYLSLYRNFKSSGSESNLVDLLTYSFNTFDWAAFSGYPSLWVLGNTSKFQGLKFSDPVAKYRKPVPAFNQQDYIDQLIRADRNSLHSKSKIKIVGLARQFDKPVVTAIFNDKKYKGNKGTSMLNGPHSFVIQISKQGDNNFIWLAGGFVTGGGGDKPIVVTVGGYSPAAQASQTPLLEFNYTGKKDTQQISLRRLPKGYYQVMINDPNKYFRIGFSPSISYATIVTAQNRLSAYTKYMCFYVPHGTAQFTVFKDISAILVSPTGRTVDMNDKKMEEIDVTVMPGEDGLWMINFLSGKFHIEGIPPFIGMDPDQMLIPKN